MELRRKSRKQYIDDDSKHGRNAMQVLSVGFVPALVCVLGSPRWKELIFHEHAPLAGAVPDIVLDYFARHYVGFYFSYLSH